MVALGAPHRCALKDVEHRGHHLIAVEMLGDSPVQFALPDLVVGNEIPRPGGEKPECDNAFGITGKKHISRDLLPHKPGEGFVLVQAADDVIAIRPCVHPRLVLVIAMRLRIARHIEPVLPELFTERG